MCTSMLKDSSQYCLYLITKEFETENNRQRKLSEKVILLTYIRKCPVRTFVETRNHEGFHCFIHFHGLPGMPQSLPLPFQFFIHFDPIICEFRNCVSFMFLSPTNALLYYTYKMLKYTVKISHDCSYLFRSVWTIIREPMPNLAKVTILCRYSVKISR